MLKLLMKYDNRALRRVLVPMLLGLLALSVLTAVLMSISLTKNAGNMVVPNIANAIDTLSSAVAGLLVLAFMAVGVGSFILIMYRFYANLMTDEGYLSFTLPVTTDQHLCSKFLTAMLWEAVSLIAMVICAIVCIEGTNVLHCLFIGQQIELWILPFITKLLQTNQVYGYIFEGIALGLAFLAASTMKVYLAVTMGFIGVRKHKMLAAVGSYIAISYAVSILQTLVIMPVAAAMFSDGNTSFHAILIITILLQVVITLGCYFITRGIMNKKLNI